MESTSARIARAERAAIVAFASAEGRFKSLPLESPPSNLGGLIIHGAKVATARQDLADICQALAAQTKSATAIIDDGLKEAQMLASVAAHLEKNEPLPAGTPADVVAQCRVLKDGHRLGAVDAVAAASEIRRTIISAVEELERVKRKWAAQALSASEVAIAKFRLDGAKAFGTPKEAEAASLRHVRVLAVHRAKFAPSDDRRVLRLREERLSKGRV